MAQGWGARVDVVAFPRFVRSEGDAFADDLGRPFDLLERIERVSRASYVVTPSGSIAFNAFFCRKRPCLVVSVGAEIKLFGEASAPRQHRGVSSSTPNCGRFDAAG